MHFCTRDFLVPLCYICGMDDLVDIVDEHDEVIGTETRGKVHMAGLLHREINIFFMTPRGELIFQRRSMAKDSNPGLLCTAVSGHVDAGMKYEDTAVKEMEEETGIKENIENLIFLKKLKVNFDGGVLGTKNHAFKKVYAYIFRGDIRDLRVEPGEGAGFEACMIDDFLNMDDEQRKKFTPTLRTKEFIEIVREMI